MHQGYSYEATEAKRAIRQYSPDDFDWTADHTPAEWATIAEGFRNYRTLSDREAHESFQNCDTDGFLSQWASGQTARFASACASLAEDHGYAEFPALFDAETGELVPAFLVEFENRHAGYGTVQKWSVRKSWDNIREYGPLIGVSSASSERKQAAHYAKHGYTEGTVRMRASMETRPGGGFNIAIVAEPLRKYDRTAYEVVTTDDHTRERSDAKVTFYGDRMAEVELTGREVGFATHPKHEAIRTGALRRDGKKWNAHNAEGEVIGTGGTWKVAVKALIKHYGFRADCFEIEQN